MAKRYAVQNFYGEHWVFTGNDFDEAEDACYFAMASSNSRRAPVRAVDTEINCVLEEYQDGLRVSKGVAPAQEESPKELYRDLLAVFEKHKDTLRRLA